MDLGCRGVAQIGTTMSSTGSTRVSLSNFVAAATQREMRCLREERQWKRNGKAVSYVVPGTPSSNTTRSEGLASLKQSQGRRHACVGTMPRASGQEKTW